MAKKEKKAVFAEGISKSDVTGVASTKNNNENRLMLKYMLFLSILSFCVYANTLPNGYAYDDEAAITTNVIVKKGISAIPELLSTPYHRGTYIEYSNKQATDNLYRPLSLIMFAVEYQIAGNTPAVGHFVNIVLYAGCVALLFLFVYRLFKKRQLFIAFIAALLFALHPIHTEVVANIKSRDELLCFFFGFLALNTFTKYIDTQRAGSLIRGLVFYFLSLLSKETSITFLAVIPFVFFFYRNEDRKRSVHIFLLSLLPAALYFSIRYSVLSAFYDSHATGVPFLDNMLTGAPSLASRLATAMLIQGNYLKLLFVPYPLICDYSYNAIPIVNFGNIWVLLTIIVYGAILFFGIYRLINKRFDPLTFGIFFFLITLSIFSNVLFLIGSDMGERFLFFPSAGFCIAVAFIMEQIVFRQATGEIPPVKDKKILFMLIPVGIIFIAITMNRNTEWKDSFTLFLADSKKAPNNCRILYFAANAEMAKVREEGTDTATKNDMLSDAIEAYQKSIIIYPEYAVAHHNLAMAFVTAGQTDSAEMHAKKAVLLEPDCDNYLNTLAGIYMLKGNPRAAIPLLEKAGIVNPGNLRYPYNTGLYFMHNNEHDSAIYYFRKVLIIDPTYTEAIKNIAGELTAAGKKDSAAKYEGMMHK